MYTRAVIKIHWVACALSTGAVPPARPGMHLYFLLLDMAVVSVDIRIFYAKCFTT